MTKVTDSPKIVQCTIDKSKLEYFVKAQFDNDVAPNDVADYQLDASMLFSYFPDELSFSEEEFIGLTRDQALELFVKRDTAYLKSDIKSEIVITKTEIQNVSDMKRRILASFSDGSTKVIYEYVLTQILCHPHEFMYLTETQAIALVQKRSAQHELKEDVHATRY